MPKIRVLVVDDSIVIRHVVQEELASQSDIEVAGMASNGVSALEKIRQLNPDLVILDIEMPEMDGLTALTHIRKSHPRTPVIMFSSLTELGAAATLEALARGATEFFAKPKGVGGLADSRKLIQSELVPAIRALCAPQVMSPRTDKSPPSPSPRPLAGLSRIDLLAIGASTGGPNALAEIFAALPAGFPVPIMVVQHMPPMFTQMLAERLSKNSRIPTVEAQTNMELEPGKAWVAPGGFHLEVGRSGGRAWTLLHQEPQENACRPAVDPLLRSVARAYGPHSLAVILTGMGRDGLRGCESIRAAGGQILVQDELTSVVWGMPGFVARAGLADEILPLSAIADAIVRRSRANRE